MDLTKVMSKPPVNAPPRRSKRSELNSNRSMRAGVKYFVGDELSALDIYWTAFANLLDPLPKEQNPMPEGLRRGFTATDPVVKAALDPLLLEHRSRIFREHFRDPMEL